MPRDLADPQNSADRVLATDEPAPFTIINDASTLPVLLVCDHASRRIPAALGDLGLDPVALRCHLAHDIGAGALTRRLAKKLSMTAVLCGYSRLVVDCNRQLMDPSAFLEFGDGVVIMGNRNLHAADKKARADAIYWPYHKAVAAQVKRLSAGGRPPIFVSMHSFTPVLNGASRPWHMGVLSDVDRLTAEIFIHDLRAAGFNVGDNEPYSGKSPQDFTVDHHAETNGLSHVCIEVRQDLIGNDEGVRRVADVFQKIVASLPARISATDVSTRRSPARSG
jgi:predicted N-formylglutamate amidohydrolase